MSARVLVVVALAQREPRGSTRGLDLGEARPRLCRADERADGWRVRPKRAEEVRDAAYGGDDHGGWVIRGELVAAVVVVNVKCESWYIAGTTSRNSNLKYTSKGNHAHKGLAG